MRIIIVVWRPLLDKTLITSDAGNNPYEIPLFAINNVH